jgi:electron transfer flavoprotein alpha subunit
MDRSRHIISIDTEPDTDMVEASDVIGVEDFRKVVPMVIEEIRSSSEE